MVEVEPQSEICYQDDEEGRDHLLQARRSYRERKEDSREDRPPLLCKFHSNSLALHSPPPRL